MQRSHLVICIGKAHSVVESAAAGSQDIVEENLQCSSFQLGLVLQVRQAALVSAP